LDIITGQVKQFEPTWTDERGDTIKIPHMGWNTITDMDRSHPLWQGIDDHAHFYFVHSYYCAPEDESVIAATCDYGQPFCASVIKDNLFATQFHPEKSHDDGLRLLKNFVEWLI
jgi:glutamine amidotransferase